AGEARTGLAAGPRVAAPRRRAAAGAAQARPAFRAAGAPTRGPGAGPAAAVGRAARLPVAGRRTERAAVLARPVHAQLPRAAGHVGAHVHPAAPARAALPRRAPAARRRRCARHLAELAGATGRAARLVGDARAARADLVRAARLAGARIWTETAGHTCAS